MYEILIEIMQFTSKMQKNTTTTSNFYNETEHTLIHFDVHLVLKYASRKWCLKDASHVHLINTWKLFRTTIFNKEWKLYPFGAFEIAVALFRIIFCSVGFADIFCSFDLCIDDS